MEPLIVVFDDTINHLRLFEAVLTRCGYRVKTFPEILRSVEQLQGLCPQLIILGHWQGFLQDEIDVLRSLREHPRFASVPVLIATTGTFSFEEIGKPTEFAHCALISKPFDARELIEAVARMFHG